MTDQKNMIIAVVLSLAVIIGWEFLFPSGGLFSSETTETAPAEPQQQQAAPTPADALDVPQPEATAAAPGGGAPRAPFSGLARLPREAALSADARIPFENARMTGSIRLRGARIDDAVLLDYHTKVAKRSPLVSIFSPENSPAPYFAEIGWAAADPSRNAVPTPDTPWARVNGSGPLTPANPLNLRWDNGGGLVFDREIGLDDNYLITVVDRVTNTGAEDATLFPYGLIARIGAPDTLGFYILHEGFTGVFDGVLEEEDYDDIYDDDIDYNSRGGWAGFSDKYWLSALVAGPDQTVKVGFRADRTTAQPRYQTDFIDSRAVVIPPGGAGTAESRLFVGAKEYTLLDAYQQLLDAPLFTRAIDFGWFHFITEPFFIALHYIFGIVGNYGVAILIFTLLIKVVFFPLANKSYRAMSEMKKLQPELMRLRDLYKDDKVRLNQEMMGLYKKNKVNPASGCLPILIQIPVFFALYKVLFVTIEMRHAPFFGWIQDLSAQDPTNVFNLFGLLPYQLPDFLTIGVWPILMGVTMFLQQKLNPAPTDEIQQKIFMFLPFIFTVMLATFPAGLVIYWTWNNVLSIAQQYFIMKRMGAPIGGGVEKKEPESTR